VLYLIAADIIVFVHFIWIIFLITGAYWGRRHRWIKRIHITGLLFAFAIQIFGWYCPLTHLEVWLRQMHDSSQSYGGSYIIHYVEKVVYIDVPPGVIYMMTVFLALISGWLYLYKPRGSVNRKRDELNGN
jgi:hypothetical protein